MLAAAAATLAMQINLALPFLAVAVLFELSVRQYFSTHLTNFPPFLFCVAQFLLAKNDDDFTTAIYSIRHKKFICFNNATGDVIAQVSHRVTTE